MAQIWLGSKFCLHHLPLETFKEMFLTLNMSIIFNLADDLQGLACTKFTGT